MASLNEISEQFETFGIEASEEVLAKCKCSDCNCFEFDCFYSTQRIVCNYSNFVHLGIDLCVTYSITDACEFVEQWMAYSVSNLEGAEPTVQYLMDMERKELVPRKAKQAGNKKAKPQTPLIHGYGSPAVRSPMPAANLEPLVDDNDDEFMDSYLCNTPKVSGLFHYYSDC